MQKRKSLSLQIAGAVAIATLFGSSAFAESRHHEGTSHGSSSHSDRGSRQSSGSRSHATSQPSQRYESRGSSTWRNDSRGSSQRNDSRGNTSRYDSRGSSQRYDSRGSTSRYDSRGNTWRNDSGRSESRSATTRVAATDRFRHVDGFRAGSGIAPYRVHERITSFGRVDRFERFGRGYRVWIGGGLFPIFVPFDSWRFHPLRIGAFIRFGGFWDPLGYWSIYDYSPYYGSGYYSDGYYPDGSYYGSVGAYNSSGEIQGVVESVDFRNGTLVINDDSSHQLVTVTMPRDRRMNDVREGDYVEFSGGWSRSGLFEASRLNRLDYARDGRDDGRY